MGLVAGRVVRGLHGVGLLMVTLGLNLLLYDFVLRATGLTGGDDGLQGITIAPVLGVFRFDMAGNTAYLYVLVVAFVVFPRGPRAGQLGLGPGAAGRARQPAPDDHAWRAGGRRPDLGLRHLGRGRRHRRRAADADHAVRLAEVLSFQRSADVLTVLIIGGIAMLYGGFIGALVFLVLRDALAALNPIYWYFWIGLLLVLIVAFFRSGILPGLAKVLVRRRVHS